MRKLMYFALPFGAGTALCQYLLPQGFWPLAALAALLALPAAALLKDKQKKRALPILATGLAAGILWYAGYASLFLDPAEALAGTEDTVELEVLDYAEESGFGARCRVKVLRAGLRGEAMYYGTYALMDLEPGNKITTAAKFYSAVNVAGEERSTYTAQGVFLRLYGKGEMAVAPGNAGSIRYLPQRLARTLRESAARLYTPQAAGLITAILTGERDGLDEKSTSDLTEAGLLHITAVSGLHCGFLIFFLGLLVFRRQRLTALLGYPVLLGYMLLAGCTPSVVRACVMVGFALLAPLAGREGDAPTSLSGALLVILAADPFAIASVSLQLSFSAVAGLLIFMPQIYNVFELHRPKLNWIADGIWTFVTGTIAASLGVMVLTAPLSALYFRSLSLVSPLSSLLVLWMAPVLFASALVVTAVPVLAPLAVGPELLARYVLFIAERLAKIPGHSVRFIGPAAVVWLVLVYVMLAVCLLAKDESRRRYLVAAVSAAVCLFAMRAMPARILSGGALTVIAVDVGQGAAALLHSGDFTALVDCGGTNSPGGAVADVMETYGWGSLDFVALTHYHEDHAGGLGELLARVEVDSLLLPQLLESDSQAALQREVLALAEQHGVPVTYIEEPRQAPLGGAVLAVYPPLSSGDTNEEGLTILCTAGEFDVLITGDMGSSTEKKLIETYDLPDIEVLVAGHHGSKYSTSEELLNAVTPEIGVISAGAHNTFGHPSQEAMERMAFVGMTLYRTDEQGNIIIQVYEQENKT